MATGRREMLSLSLSSAHRHHLALVAPQERRVDNRSYRCDTCDLHITGAATLRSHYRGKRHLARAEARRGLLRCKICGKDFSSALQLRQHRVGRPHYRRAARLFQQRENERLRKRRYPRE
jgi:Zinc-finger of C2H2 type